MRVIVALLVLCGGCRADHSAELFLECTSDGRTCSCDFTGEAFSYEACPADPLAPHFCCATAAWPDQGSCECHPVYCYATSGSGGRCRADYPPDGVSLADWCPYPGGACVKDSVSCACGDECLAVNEPLVTCDADHLAAALDLCASRGLLPVTSCQ